MKLDIPGTILLNALAGSHAYGLNTLDSDEDFRGVFIAEKSLFYSGNYPLELSDELNNSSYFELSKFVDLLSKNNPTVLEFLAYPERCIREKHPLFSLFKPEDFLNKQCQNSYVGYALGQIRKAYELKKRISFPEDTIEKSAIDFCSVLHQGTVRPMVDSGFSMKGYSLSEINDSKDIYALWLAESTDEIKLNETHQFVELKEGSEFKGYLLFDRSGYVKYKKEFKSYFLWTRDRKKEGLPLDRGQYDGKFLMHTFRLLYTARDIATRKEIRLERPEREKLLGIRKHQFAYGELIREAEDLIEEVRELFRVSDLPDSVSPTIVSELVYRIRDEIYSKNRS